MTAIRNLIVNADDFGRSPGINRGIIRAHEQGILTSTSMMVRWPAAVEAAAYARLNPRLSVGLHLDLAEWKYSETDGWKPIYEVVNPEDPVAIAAEIQRQLQTFRDLMQCEPTHFDSHQHVHNSEPVLSLLRTVAHSARRVLRSHDRQVRYFGGFYGQADKSESYPEWVSPTALIGLLKEAGPGFTEFGCHPGEGADFDSVYCRERSIECDTLCDPSVRAAIEREKITLVSFRDIYTG